MNSLEHFEEIAIPTSEANDLKRPLVSEIQKYLIRFIVHTNTNERLTFQLFSERLPQNSALGKPSREAFHYWPPSNVSNDAVPTSSLG